MDDLYQSSSYPYLPQSTFTNYHQHNPMYRLNNNSSTFDRPFHIPPVNETESVEPYNWSSNSHHHHYSPQHHVAPRVNYCSVPPTNAMLPSPRPKITTNVWEDEGTVCFQVDAKGICVARRQDNDMINGTKLLNVVGMSRGKRDGILKNEKGRIVVKVGAMHLKGVWIPFARARELATKFKIMDLLFPLFADEPNSYIPADGAQHESNEMLPAVTNKCNLASPQLAFNHKNCSDEYHNASSSSPAGLPTTWDRSYQLTPTSSHYDDYQPGQILHRASHPDLHSLTGSPIPRSMLQHSHAAATTSEDNNDYYLLNNPQSEHQGYDYYNRQLNRSSFSSLSSHHSYLYPSYSTQTQEEDRSTSASYLDHHSNYYTKSTLSDPYSKSSPYATNTTIPATVTETLKELPTVTENQTTTTTKSVGSTTPSSWLSPETPTAVLFQHKEKAQTTTATTTSKKRKSSLSLETTTVMPASKKRSSPASSPAIRATKRTKVVKSEN